MGISLNPETMARILIDLPDEQLEALARIVERERRPRAAVIRDAVQAYVDQHRPHSAADAFGLWKGRQIDGLTYQDALRAEW